MAVTGMAIGSHPRRSRMYRDLGTRADAADSAATELCLRARPDRGHVGRLSAACRELGLAETEDPLRELVARKIIECAQTGERDQTRLCDCALNAIRA